jgi:hypothetical protein
MKLIFEDIATCFEYEDGRSALIIQINHDNSEVYDPDKEHYDADDRNLFIRLQSWNEITKEHPELEKLINKKIRITVEDIS